MNSEHKNYTNSYYKSDKKINYIERVRKEELL